MKKNKRKENINREFSLFPKEVFRRKISRELSFIWRNGICLLCKVDRKGRLIKVIRNAHAFELYNYPTVTTIIRLEKDISHYKFAQWTVVEDNGWKITLQRDGRRVEINVYKASRSIALYKQTTITDSEITDMDSNLLLPLQHLFSPIKVHSKCSLENWLERYPEFVAYDNKSHRVWYKKFPGKSPQLIDKRSENAHATYDVKSA